MNDLDAWKICGQRLSAGLSPMMGSNLDRRLFLRVACFLGHLAALIGLIKEPLLPVISRYRALFGFAAEDLVSQQPNMVFQVADLLLERGDDLLELGGVIRQAVNIQTHARRIAEA